VTRLAASIAHRLRLILLALATLLPGLAPAHELSMAEMRLRELAPGAFLWHWSGSGLGSQPQDELRPVWPAGCRADGDQLNCAQGLTGTVAVEGVGASYSAAMLRVTWLDGQTRVYTITEGQPSVRLYGAADDRRGAGEIGWAYGVLGVEHILGGLDHLLFVVCLLFLVGFNRRLVWTVTAFTAAHSLTLILSALGWLTLRAPPVEAAIAMSIVLMAAEALRRDDSLTRRLPAAVAFGFGLLHGLGFAGALEAIGLPQNHLLLALLTFNLGVELGQLLTVAAAFLLLHLARRLLTSAQRLARPVLYAIGSLAAYWSWLRIAAIVG
jgi:hydrogenase/urease accessory protein HupE